MYGGDPSLGDPDVFYYLTVYNENYVMPPLPDRPGIAQAIVEGLYQWADAPAATGPRATVLFSGTAFGAGGEGYVRLCFAPSHDTLKEGVGRLVEALQRRALVPPHPATQP